MVQKKIFWKLPWEEVKKSLLFTTVQGARAQFRMGNGNKGVSENVQICMHTSSNIRLQSLSINPSLTRAETEIPGASSSCMPSGNWDRNWSWLSPQTKAYAFSVQLIQLSPVHVFPFCKISWHLSFTIVSNHSLSVYVLGVFFLSY